MTSITAIPYVADFNQPLETVKSHHHAVHQWCAVLNGQIQTWSNPPLQANAIHLLQQAHSFISVEVFRHWQDEELDLFPPVTRVSLKFAEAVYRAKTQHQELRTLWDSLAHDMEYAASCTSLPKFKARLQTFLDALETNIKYEDTEFYPRAQHLLSSHQLQAIGENMRERRKST